MQLQDGIGLIIFMREQHTDLKALKILFHLGVFFFAKREDIFIHIFFKQFAAFFQIGQ